MILSIALLLGMVSPYLTVAAENEETEAADPTLVTEAVSVENYIREVTMAYQSGGSWVTIDENTRDIPADARFKITLTYDGVSTDEVIAHRNSIKYTLPDLLIDPSVVYNMIEDGDRNEIGTIRADVDSKTILLTFTDAFLAREEEEGIYQINGTFSFYAGADREEIREKPDRTLVVGNQEIPLHFEKDSDARLGELNLQKSTGSFGVDEDGAYLQYTVTVSTGDTPMPEVKVTDLFTANAKYVERYLGVSGTESSAATEENEKQVPYEIGDKAGSGKIYIGKSITDGQPIPDPAGSSYSAPGVLVWNVGDMQANETRSLVYKVRLQQEYIGGQSKGTITNKVTSYSKTYPHQNGTADFTPSAKMSVTKSAGAYVPDASGDGGTITYQVTVGANENNTYDLTNVKIHDSFSGGATEEKYLASLDYVEKSFQLYKGGSVDTSKKMDLPDNPHDGKDNPDITSSDTEKRFDLYVGTMKPGEQRTLTYQVRVRERVFAAGNEEINLGNSAGVYSDDTISDGNYRFASAKSTKTLGKKVWNRKLQSEKTDVQKTITVGDDEKIYEKKNDSWQEATDAERSFTVPAGSYEYQVVVNEAADWDVSSAVFGDALKNGYLAYTGYLRIDYYAKGLSSQPATDKEAVRLLEEQKVTQRVWADIHDGTVFSFAPEDIEFPEKKGAFVLTYYAVPKNVEDVSQVSSGNSFGLSGTVVGPGGTKTEISGVRVSISVVIEGEKKMEAVKQGWYFDHNRDATGDWKYGHLYWVIDVKGSEIDAGTEFKDVPSTISGQKHLQRATSMTGLYVGKIPDEKSFTEYYGTVKDLTADTNMRKLTGNVRNGGAVPADADYSWSATNEQATIRIRKTLQLKEGEHLYIVIQTAPNTAMAARNCRTFVNSLEIKDSNATDFVKANDAEIRAVGAGTNFKELAGVYDYDGTSWKNVQKYNGNSYSKLLTKVIKDPGTYVEWRIKINYAGDLEGTVHVEDLIPEGLEPIYARYFWIHPEIYNNAPETPEIEDLENNDAWGRMELTDWIDGSNKGPKQRTCIAYYNKETRQLRFDVTNLQKGGAAQDRRSLEIQVVTKVSDSDMVLNGVQKTYTNGITVKNESQKVISESSVPVSLTKKTISKIMGNVVNHRLPFTLTVNSLGEDLVPGSDTLTLVDEMQAPLQFDVDSLEVRDQDGNKVEGISPKIEETDNGERLILTVPDEKKLAITYEALLNSAPDQDIPVNNSAYWFGYRQDMAQIKNATVQYHVEATAGTGQRVVLSIKKADQDNAEKGLEGAGFTLQQVVWNADTAAWEPAGNAPVLTGTTDGTGKVLFGKTGEKLSYNTVYCLKETKAPEGYVLEGTPRYYVVAKTVDDVYPEELEQWHQQGAEIYYSGSTYKVTIYNRRGTLDLTKQFQDVNGKTVSRSKIPDGTYRFGLYAYKSNGNYKNEKVLQTLEIICKNGEMTYKQDGTSIEKAEFTQLSVGARYCVMELDADGLPVEKNEKIYTAENGLMFRVKYTGGLQTVTIPQNGKADTVEIVNQQYVNIDPGTGIVTESNLLYGILLGGIAVLGIWGLVIRRKRRRK